jgi:hypothetical protein
MEKGEDAIKQVSMLKSKLEEAHNCVQNYGG